MPIGALRDGPTCIRCGKRLKGDKLYIETKGFFFDPECWSVFGKVVEAVSGFGVGQKPQRLVSGAAVSSDRVRRWRGAKKDGRHISWSDKY